MRLVRMISEILKVADITEARSSALRGRSLSHKP